MSNIWNPFYCPYEEYADNLFPSFPPSRIHSHAVRRFVIHNPLSAIPAQADALVSTAPPCRSHGLYRKAMMLMTYMSDV